MAPERIRTGNLLNTKSESLQDELPWWLVMKNIDHYGYSRMDEPYVIVGSDISFASYFLHYFLLKYQASW